MGYTALRATTQHPNKKDPDKPYSKEVGTAIVDEELAAFMKEKNFRVSFLPHAMPGVQYTVWPPKDWDNDDPGDGKGGRW